MKLREICVIIVMVLAMPLCCKADISLPLTPPKTENPDDEIPGLKRHRTPPAPVICFINIENGSVSFSSAAVGEVEEYQICDEEGEICFCSYNTAAEFTNALNNLTGEYCIKFLTVNGYYSGYINM
ncbi:MAG: hypothetical protein K2K08_07525 [Paramuribaculum sp.]|nr:hypothetical protein [Paramuribaculum sp.]